MVFLSHALLGCELLHSSYAVFSKFACKVELELGTEFSLGKKKKKQNQIQFSVVHKALTFAGLGQVMVSSLSSNFYGEVDSWT